MLDMHKITSLSIQAARVENGYTQEAIAEKLGISRDRYNRLENGKEEMKPYFIYALAYIFQMDADLLRVPELTMKESTL